MSVLLGPKLALARGVGALSRLRGGGASSAPGKVLMRLDGDALGALAGRLTRGSVVVSATNGKTTTAALTAGILAHERIPVVHNASGANMAGGIASALLAAARPHGAITGELGLFEVDELWLGEIATQVHPRAILLGNLFRDQLDRYGELEHIAESWTRALAAGPGRAAQLVLNADDPMVADLGRERDAVYFGVEDPSLALPGMAHAADAKHCRRCGAPYVFDAIYLGHLGHYHCTHCGQHRPEPTVIARKIILSGVRTASFALCTPLGEREIHLALPGLYNVYNALAAAALAFALGVELEGIVAGLEDTHAAFGRAESVMVGAPAHPRELRILLVKNPAGANEVLRTLVLEPGAHDVLGVLNDNIADGRDVSWIWDADFELLAERVRRVTCAGTRAAELAVRLKYAGVDPARIVVREDLAGALRDAAADVPPAGYDLSASDASPASDSPSTSDASPTSDGGPPPLYALPTYTAMLALRELLVARGEARSAWS